VRASTVTCCAAALTTLAAHVAAPAAGARGASSFVAGSALATSQAFAVAPRDAGLNAVVTFGRTIADYRNSLAQASSQAIDLGLIGSTLTVQCSSLPPPAKPGQLPQPLVVESDGRPAHAVKSTAGPASGPATAATAREEVTASGAPHEAATATYDEERIELPGALAVTGLSSSGFAQLVPGQNRIADATAGVSTVSLGGGKVVLRGLHWEARRQTGARSSALTEFTIGSATVNGSSMPTSGSSLPATLAAVNRALTSTGLHVTAPTVSRRAGVFAVGPLSIGIDNSRLGGMIINPLIDALGPVTDPVVNTLTGAVCQLGSFYSLVNLLLSGFDGIGGLDLEIGGASATVNDTTYANPFGTATFPGTNAAGPAPPGASATGGKAGPLPGTSSSTGAGPPPQLAGQPEVSSSCATTSPAGRPSCSNGAGLVVGLIALATLGGMAGADYAVVRRRQRLRRMAMPT
jgi:hypothetical protein